MFLMYISGIATLNSIIYIIIIIQTNLDYIAQFKISLLLYLWWIKPTDQKNTNKVIRWLFILLMIRQIFKNNSDLIKWIMLLSILSSKFILLLLIQIHSGFVSCIKPLNIIVLFMIVNSLNYSSSFSEGNWSVWEN